MKNQVKICSVTILMFALLGFTVAPKSKTIIVPISVIKGNLNPPLEAVLVVGNIQEGTASSIEDMDALALLFQKNKIKVTKFYDKNTNWEAIKRAAKTASFFVYSGHGSNMGINGKTGGLCLVQRISTKQILEELKLKKNVVVLFKSVCRAAGSSAEDFKDIGVGVASTRVTDYSEPFFSLGAGCYYADNFDGGCLLFLTEFLAGKTIDECVKETIDNAQVSVVFSEAFPNDIEKKITITSCTRMGTITETSYIKGVKKVKSMPIPKQYDLACVADPVFTIADL